VGKTTLLRRVIQESVASFYGIISERFERGYYVEDVITGERRILCSKEPIGMKIKGYYFDPHVLAFIERSLQRSGDILVYDEIGWMETEKEPEFDIWKYIEDPALLIVREELVEIVSSKFPVTIFVITRENQEEYVNPLIEEVSHLI
jgi:nucleoside-triphosphatase THEP1